MKEQDIFNQIKKQAKAKEQQDFDAKEQVWDKIESQLDKKDPKKRIIPLWSWGVAASVLLIAGLGIWQINTNQEAVHDKASQPSLVNSTNENHDGLTQEENNSQTSNSQTIANEEKTKVLDTLEKTAVAVEKQEQKNENILPPPPPYTQAIKIELPSPEIEENAVDLSEIVVTGCKAKSQQSQVAAATAIAPNSSPSPIAVKRTGRVILDKNAKPLSNEVNQMLSGYVAGVQVNGATGNANEVSIRGTSTYNSNQQPLYIVDGVPYNQTSISEITPNLINKVTVLKDASATAMYGSRGQNGVIVIETKNLSNKEKRKLRRAYRKAQKENKKSHSDTIQLDFKVEVSQESYEAFQENPFESPAVAPLSTFSIDVDKASYSNIRRFLNNGQTVPKDAVRVEEMINYFDYSYPEPKGNDPLAIHTEMSVAPWNPKHKLLKIGLQAKKIATDNLPPSNLVFLIDVSGSMSDQNKLPLLKSSMRLLVDNLRQEDKVSMVVYAGAAGLVLPPTSGDKKQTILNALDKLNAGGSTAGGAGIELAYKTAKEHFIQGGNNRVIIATDGDFNVGASSNMDMEDLIEEKRKTGVFLTVLGYGMGNYKDDKMEILADKGNGNYAYIDNMQEANKYLVQEFGGSMYTVAKDVKVQIEFNPANVQAYRLIGYENRRLRPEDFKNDAIDAGEMGSGHTVTALYEIILVGTESNYFVSPDELKYSKTQKTSASFGNEIGTVKFRYKKPDEDISKELTQIIPNHSKDLAWVSPDFKFASAVAWFGLKLRDSKYIPNKSTKDIKKLAREGRGKDEEGYRAEFIRLVDVVR